MIQRFKKAIKNWWEDSSLSLLLEVSMEHKWLTLLTILILATRRNSKECVSRKLNAAAAAITLNHNNHMNPPPPSPLPPVHSTSDQTRLTENLSYKPVQILFRACKDFYKLYVQLHLPMPLATDIAEATKSCVAQYFYAVHCSVKGMKQLDQQASAIEAYTDLAVHVLGCCFGKGDEHHNRFIDELILIFFREFHYTPDEAGNTDNTDAVHTA